MLFLLQVQIQAAYAISQIAARNNENQTLVGALGALDKLAIILQSNLRSASTVNKLSTIEKLLTAMLCIMVKHPINRQLLVRM